MELIDRELDLMAREVKECNLEGLRKRICTLFLQYIKIPKFNPEVAKILKVVFLDCNLINGYETKDRDGELKAMNALLLPITFCCRIAVGIPQEVKIYTSITQINLYSHLGSTGMFLTICQGVGSEQRTPGMDWKIWAF